MSLPDSKTRVNTSISLFLLNVPYLRVAVWKIVRQIGVGPPMAGVVREEQTNFCGYGINSSSLMM